MKPQSTKLLFGYHPVREALIARRRQFDVIYLARGKGESRRADIADLATRSGVAVQWVSPQKITALVGHPQHQDVAAQVSAYPACSLDDILDTVRDHDSPLLLVLDQVVDPQNFGAIVRSALCAGVAGVVVPKDHSAPPSPAASKASAGALEHMPVAYETNLVNTFKTLKGLGFWIAGADRGGDQSLYQADLKGPLAIAIGSEEKGLRPLVKRHCDFIISIPQSGPVGSLNASAAAAVIVYEAYRQRNTA